MGNDASKAFLWSCDGEWVVFGRLQSEWRDNSSCCLLLASPAKLDVKNSHCLLYSLVINIVIEMCPLCPNTSFHSFMYCIFQLCSCSTYSLTPVINLLHVFNHSSLQYSSIHLFTYSYIHRLRIYSCMHHFLEIKFKTNEYIHKITNTLFTNANMNQFAIH